MRTIKRNHIVIDQLTFDIPSEFLNLSTKQIIVRDVKVLPVIENDIYLLHSNIVQSQVSTDSSKTSQFVGFCNQMYPLNKSFFITKNIRTFEFWFTSLSGTPINQKDLAFVIELDF